MKCIVANDIGCYGLGVLPPFEAVDTSVCMGSAIALDSVCAIRCPPSKPNVW